MIRPIALLCISLMLASGVATAQVRPDRPNRPGSTSASITVITRTINDCENSTNKFVRSLRRALRQNNTIDSSREDNLNRSARELEQSLNQVGKPWNKDKDIGKTRRRVEDALESARNINLTMRNRRLREDTEELWQEVRVQMNLLARAFELPALRW